MRLTKNEKRALKLLLEDAKISDSAIAKKLKISSQAVGKIRKKLEDGVIESYTLNLNYSRLGINAFAIALAKMTDEGLEEGEEEVEEVLLNTPHIVQIFRLPHGSYTHALVYGFRDVGELDEFFHSPKQKQELHNYIENKEFFTFSHSSLVKNSPTLLFHKIIDEMGLGR
jgi:DNA-binding Lrp family transcriptional regulator